MWGLRYNIPTIRLVDDLVGIIGKIDLGRYYCYCFSGLPPTKSWREDNAGMIMLYY